MASHSEEPNLHASACFVAIQVAPEVSELCTDARLDPFPCSSFWVCHIFGVKKVVLFLLRRSNYIEIQQ